MNIHDLYAPFLRHFRTRRMRRFQRMFNVTAGTRILDVGGYLFNWSLLDVQPDLTILNLHSPNGVHGNAAWVVGDGRCLPFRDKSFDVVLSNSVIEHLGTFESQQKFACEIDRVGRRYYVQTPYRWFPVEPHLLTPLVHFLPRSWLCPLLRNFTLWGWITRPSKAQCQGFVDEVLLLDRKGIGALFPDAEIQKEYFAGLVKSLIAVRNAPLDAEHGTGPAGS